MKKIKYIFMLLLIIMLSGCKIESNVSIESDGSVKEDVKVLTETSNISSKEDRIRSYLDTAIESYEKALSIRNYDYDLIIKENDYSGVKLTNSFDDVCNYIEKTLFSQYLYKKINCIETSSYYEIKSETEHIKYCDECSAWPSLDEVKLNIKLPVDALENNADKVSDKTYTWEYDKYTSDDKSIYLKISKDSLKEKQKEEKKGKDIKKSISILSIILAITLIIFIIIFIFRLLYKKYKANKLEY